MAETPSKNPISNFLRNNTSVSKTKDDSTLLEIHIGNPLRKITQLLEEIKKQKAFSFTLKGSLGIMGVALALSVFGFFGGSKMLCDKGVQTKLGTLKVLTISESEPSIPLLGPVINYYKKIFSIPVSSAKHNRTILASQEGIIHLPYTRNASFSEFANQNTFATGEYDSCSKTLKVSGSKSLELIQ